MFVSTDNGLVNLAHVARVAPSFSGDRHILYDTDGASIGRVNDPNFDPDLLVAPVIPAAPGTTVIVIAEPKGEQRPTADDLWHEKIPVLGWRCMPYGAEPIVWDPETLKAGLVFHRMPDGSLVCPGAWVYSGLDQALAGLLYWEQQNWDRRHGVSEKSAVNHCHEK